MKLQRRFPSSESFVIQLGKPNSKGSALILTLAAVVLLTVVILAFFSTSLLNRQIAFSSTHTITADLMARSALDIITGELRDEMTDPTRSTVTTTSGISVYSPGVTGGTSISTNTDLPPFPKGVDYTSVSGSIVKVSASGVPIRPTGTIKGSPNSIGNASQNGRYFSSTRWFGISGGPQLGSQNTLPTWLFVTRGNGVKTPTIANALNSTSNDYVIGRFAYTVYDISGLLDANVAGYPTGTSTTTIGLKGSAAYANLSMLAPGNTTAQTALATLPTWRNASTGTTASTFTEWATGLKPAPRPPTRRL